MARPHKIRTEGSTRCNAPVRASNLRLERDGRNRLYAISTQTSSHHKAIKSNSNLELAGVESFYRMASFKRKRRPLCSLDGCLRPHAARGLCDKHYRYLYVCRNATRRIKKLNLSNLDEIRSYIRSMVVEDGDGCWIWQGSKTSGEFQYGIKAAGGRSILAHRLSAYAFKDFDYKSNLLICHRCDVPLCVNPEHLFPGTPADNMRDMMRKGRRTYPRGSACKSAKLSEKDVREIIRRCSMGESRLALAREFGVYKSTIRGIVLGKQWKHVSLSPTPRIA